MSIACDVVARTGNPLSRQSTTDLAKRAAAELNKPIGRTTVREILDEDAVKKYVREHLARYKVPREVVFLDELPRNPTGKILKRELRNVEVD